MLSVMPSFPSHYSLLGRAHPEMLKAYSKMLDLKLQVGNIRIVSYLQQRAFYSEWHLRHFLWKDKWRHRPEPKNHLAGSIAGGGGWEVVFSVPPFTSLPPLEFYLHKGNQASSTRSVFCLCALSETAIPGLNWGNCWLKRNFSLFLKDVLLYRSRK